MGGNLVEFLFFFFSFKAASEMIQTQLRCFSSWADGFDNLSIDDGIELGVVDIVIIYSLVSNSRWHRHY